MQIHPVAIEAAVPLGKKVRLGEERKKRKRKEKRKRSKSKSPSKSKPSPTTDQEAAAAGREARAERLAANLGDLLIDLPTTEAPSAAATASPPSVAVDLSDLRRRSSRQESPTKTPSPQKSRSRHHKSLSPDKTTKAAIRATLAESVTSLSKSFEKLDLITGHHRRRKGHGDEAEQRKQRRRKRSSQPPPPPQPQPKKPPEVTIAKLGRFKFSFEVGGNKEGGRKGEGGRAAADGPPTAASARQQSSHIRQRKKSSPAKMNEASIAVAAEAAAAAAAAAAKSTKSSGA